ncbi:MAG: beta-galactosidase, partial [Clostridiales bacterium]|nr:beta-galactosidase [Clostridiales bacterium]
FYKGRPALTVNNFGKGKAYYIAFRSEFDFLAEFYTELIRKLNISKVIDTELPEGVSAQKRSDGQTDYVFLMNFSNEEKVVTLDKNLYEDMVEGEQVEGSINLSGYGVKILERK